MTRFDDFCDSLIQRAVDAGWRLESGKTIPYGRQFALSDPAGRKAVLNAYEGKKGLRHVMGGKDAEALSAALGEDSPRASRLASPASSPDPFGLGLPRVGGDESGKGDFFGPLVVAAFHLDARTDKTLRDAGIADSKKLSDSAILKLAGLLDKTGRGETLRLMPPEYNESYARVGNLNRLLADLHGRCIQSLVKRLGAPKAILVDQFARDGSALAAAVNAPQGTQLVTKTRGESDLAVAAASILARAAFVQGLAELSAEYGMTLPPGAGPPVLKAGRAFVRSFGKAELGKVAKLHFKTSAQL